MLELIAALFTIVCVWLANKRNIMSWPVGIVGVILYSFIFLNSNLYAEFGLQIIFLIQSIYGWYFWVKHKDSEHSYKIKPDRLNKREIISSFLIGIILFIISGFLLSNFTNASIPWLDTFLASFSLVANYLLSKRKIENWYIWIFLDVIYVVMFIYKELYITSILYSILLVLAINGLRHWKKNINILKQ